MPTKNIDNEGQIYYNLNHSGTDVLDDEGACCMQGTITIRLISVLDVRRQQIAEAIRNNLAGATPAQLAEYAILTLAALNAEAINTAAAIGHLTGFLAEEYPGRLEDGAWHSYVIQAFIDLDEEAGRVRIPPQ